MNRKQVQKKVKRPGRSRVIRFAIAGVALAMAFAITVYKSQGTWQFTWNPQSLFAQPELEEGAYDLSSIVVLNRVLLQLQENYVEPERFKPRYMLASGLDEIQKSVAQIVATFDKPIKDGPDQVELQVGDATETFAFGDIESLWEMSLKYKEIFRFIQENLDDEVDPKDIEYAAINGVLKTLDPHSILLSPEVYADMLEGNRGNFGGLGIVIRMIQGELTVIEPMGDSTPAGEAGILRGDRIVQIGAQSTLNMDISEAVELLRGEPGTEVSLMIDRPGANWESPRRFELVRDEIKIPSVESAALDNQIGYIKLTGFQGNTYKDMVSHLEELEDEMDGIKGLVLDLRGNPGGLLDKAIDIADEFIDDGTVVTTVGSGRRYRKPYQAHEKGTQPHYPIAVLIDPGSASASEIVAGALKNHDRAIILGDTSFGKGSVQVLYELQDGSALKLTIAQYLTPGDVSIQSVGIVPDIKLVPMTVDPDDPDLFLRRWVRREVNLSSHLDHESALHDEKPSSVLKYVAEIIEPEPEQVVEATGEPGAQLSAAEGDDDDEKGHDEFEDTLPDEEEESSPSEDPQVQVAHDLLVAAGTTWKRPELLDKLKPRIDELDKREDSSLTGYLNKWHVDWSAGDNPEKLDLAVTMSTDKPDDEIEAGDEVELSITVTNNGTETVHRVFGITEASTRRLDDIEYVFGKLEPGESVTRTHTVRVSSSQRPRHDVVELALYTNDMEPTDDPLLTQSLDISTDAPAMPHFAFAYAVVDDKGNGDGRANPGEDVTINVYVENTGQGAAERPVAYIKNLN